MCLDHEVNRRENINAHVQVAAIMQSKKMRRKQQDNIQFGNLQTKAHRMVFFTLAFMMICSKVTGS